MSELDRVSLAYEARKIEFVTEFETIMDYIRDQAQFDTLCGNVRFTGHNAGQSDENRGKFIQAIDALVSFIKTD